MEYGQRTHSRDLPGAAAHERDSKLEQILVYWVGDREIGGKSFA